MNCPECCSDMDEIEPDLHMCMSCGFKAEQIAFEMEWDEEGERDD